MAQRKMLPGLDGIRLAAIVWIVIYHFGVETATAGLYAPRFFTSPACAALVQGAVFWMTALSGVCLGLKYAGRPLRPGEYVKSRFLAIYPLFWLFFLPLFFYSDILHGNNAGVPRWKVVLSLIGMDGYLQPWTATFYKIGEWYLGVQVLLYCLFPLILLCSRRRAGRLGLAAALLALWLAAPRILPAEADVFHTVLGQLPVFAAGTALGQWLAAPPAAAPQRYLPWLLTVGLLDAALTLGLLGMEPYWTYSLAALGLFWPAFRLGQLLRGRGAALAHRASRLCYGVYLAHHVGITLVLIPLLAGLGGGAALWWAGLAACLAGAFLAAAAGQGIVSAAMRLSARKRREKAEE